MTVYKGKEGDDTMVQLIAGSTLLAIATTLNILWAKKDKVVLRVKGKSRDIDRRRYLVFGETEDGVSRILKIRHLNKEKERELFKRIEEGEIYSFKVKGREILPIREFKNIYKLKKRTPKTL